MSFTLVTVNLLNAAAASTPFGAFNDGTYNYFAHPLLDNTGAIISPATAGNQATANTALAAIQAAVTAATPAGSAIIGKVSTDQTAHGTTDLVAADITKVAGVSFTLGQQLAAASLPVVMTAAQITALSAPVLGAGANSIGTVGINSGTNSIGSVSLNAGSNTIGNVGLAAGSAKIGVVTTDQTTHGTTDLVAADITKVGGVAFALGQQLAAGSIPIVLTAAQLASLIAPILGAGTNNIGAVSAGVNVVTGNTLTRPADTNVYAFGDLIANITGSGITVPTIAAARATNVPTVAVRCRLQKNNTSTTNAIFRVHFWNAAPTVASGDNGVFTPTFANYCGSFDVTCNLAGSDFAFGIGVPTMGPSMAFIPASGTSNLYYLIEARAVYTPTSGEIFTPYLEIQ